MCRKKKSLTVICFCFGEHKEPGQTAFVARNQSVMHTHELTDAQPQYIYILAYICMYILYIFHLLVYLSYLAAKRYCILSTRLFLEYSLASICLLKLFKNKDFFWRSFKHKISFRKVIGRGE